MDNIDPAEKDVEKAEKRLDKRVKICYNGNR
jgi:hypothetical protein